MKHCNYHTKYMSTCLPCKWKNETAFTDKDRLDWLELKQVSGYYLYDVIHWSGKTIRDHIDAEMWDEMRSNLEHEEPNK